MANVRLIIKSEIIMILLYIMFPFLFGGCITKDEKELFLIPKDFKGTVLIIFDQKDGAEKEYDEEHRRVYKIPNSGILYTQFPVPESGEILDQKFFYLRSDNSKGEEILNIDLEESYKRKIDENKVYIIKEYPAGFENLSPNVVSPEGKTRHTDINFLCAIIGKLSEQQILLNKNDSIIKATIDKYRKENN